MSEKDPKNAFVDALKELQSGATMLELADALTQLISQVRMVGKEGSITLTIKVKPKANSPQLAITDDIKVVPPKFDRDITIMYADDKGRLSRRDPRQPMLPAMVRSISGSLDKVDTDTGEIK